MGNPMKSIVKFKLQERDRSLLQFLFYWKVASFALIRHRFFKDNKNDLYAYKRIQSLRKLGFIKVLDAVLYSSPQNGYKQVLPLTLTAKGFELIRNEVGASEKVVSKDPYHDLLVSAMHVGHYLGNLEGNNVLLRSRAQLQAVPPAQWADWIPRSEHPHVPDGFWKFRNGNTDEVIALEVETYASHLDGASGFLSYYRRAKQLKKILWMVDDAGTAKRNPQKDLLMGIRNQLAPQLFLQK